MADKTLIIKRIKEAYKLRTNVAVARFLGVSAQVLSNWQNRNTVNYDTILPKCIDLNLNWLINGEGEIFKNGESLDSQDNSALAMANEEGEPYKQVELSKTRRSKAKVANKTVRAKSKVKKH